VTFERGSVRGRGGISGKESSREPGISTKATYDLKTSAKASGNGSARRSKGGGGKGLEHLKSGKRSPILEKGGGQTVLLEKGGPAASKRFLVKKNSREGWVNKKSQSKIKGWACWPNSAVFHGGGGGSL